MNPNVAFEFEGVTACVVTMRTQEGLLVGMDAHVALELGLLDRRVFALWTLVRLFLRMPSRERFGQIRRSKITERSKIAGSEVLVTVVPDQLALGRKRQAAFGTLVRFLP